MNPRRSHRGDDKTLNLLTPPDRDRPRAEEREPSAVLDIALHERVARTRASALWGAYGDALGFVSELTDVDGLFRRTRGQPLDRSLHWPRRIGGRSGVVVELPPGTYSDDTQLRLATSRAISRGGFDVEAFAKVELPVWPCYALGGGKSTKAAAGRLARPGTAWFSNAYPGWLEAGGNGAAMRVQPHVWASHDLKPHSYLADVIRNSVCTHGNIRGLAGAALHAGTLAIALKTGSLPTPDDLPELLDVIAQCPDAVQEDAELDELWRPAWERALGTTLVRAWDAAMREVVDALEPVQKITRTSGDRARAYGDLLTALNLFDPPNRGNAVSTAAVALGLGWLEPDPEAAMIIAANAVGSDTDTIATMAGCLLGAASGKEPSQELLDRELIASDAERVARIAQGLDEPGHRYPDLLHWVAPKTQADGLVQTPRGPMVLGLGYAVDMLGEPIPAPTGNASWQWLRLRSSQTVLIKRRQKLPRIREGLPDERDDEAGRKTPSTVSRQSGESGGSPVTSVVDQAPGRQSPRSSRTEANPPRDVDRAVAWLEEKRYSDAAIAFVFRSFALEGSVEQMIALATVVRERLRGRDG